MWIILLILLLIFTVEYYELNSVWRKGLSYYYNEKVIYFKELNKTLQIGGIVFLGDSITEQFMVSEFFMEYYVINRGIYGDTTDGVLKRLKESVYDLKPSIVFLLIGTNDLGKGKEIKYIVNNIRNIIKNIHETLPETKIFLQSIYPVRKYEHNKIKKRIVGKRNNEDIKRINEEIMKISNSFPITYIDINSLLKDKCGDLKIEYALDGLHLTPLAYRTVMKEIEKYLIVDGEYIEETK